MEKELVLSSPKDFAVHFVETEHDGFFCKKFYQNDGYFVCENIISKETVISDEPREMNFLLKCCGKEEAYVERFKKELCNGHYANTSTDVIIFRADEFKNSRSFKSENLSPWMLVTKKEKLEELREETRQQNEKIKNEMDDTIDSMAEELADILNKGKRFFNFRTYKKEDVLEYVKSKMKELKESSRGCMVINIEKLKRRLG